jgi:hypothetical protein
MLAEREMGDGGGCSMVVELLHFNADLDPL